MQVVEHAHLRLVVGAAPDLPGAGPAELAVAGIPVAQRGELRPHLPRLGLALGPAAVPAWGPGVERQVREAHAALLQSLAVDGRLPVVVFGQIGEEGRVGSQPDLPGMDLADDGAVLHAQTPPSPFAVGPGVGHAGRVRRSKDAVGDADLAALCHPQATEDTTVYLHGLHAPRFVRLDPQARLRAFSRLAVGFEPDPWHERAVKQPQASQVAAHLQRAAREQQTVQRDFRLGVGPGAALDLQVSAQDHGRAVPVRRAHLHALPRAHVYRERLVVAAAVEYLHDAALPAEFRESFLDAGAGLRTGVFCRVICELLERGPCLRHRHAHGRLRPRTDGGGAVVLPAAHISAEAVVVGHEELR